MNKFKILFLFPNETMVGVVPSNLAILSSYLKLSNFDVKLFDCTLYQSIRYDKNETQDNIREKLGHIKKTEIDKYAPLKTTNAYDDFMDTVNSYKPDIIAITLTDSTIQISYSFLEMIKHKNIPVVVGGVGVLFSYEKILKSGYVNYVCLGEGEISLPELCSKIQKNEDTTNIKNICYKNENAPWVIERLECYIFNPKYKTKL